MDVETPSESGPAAPPVVAVVVVHEPGPWFADVLSAHARLDYPNLDHLFLLTNDPGGYAERIRGELPRAHVSVLDANPGFGACANEVLQLVEGDHGLFCFFHDDAAPDPDALSVMVEELGRSHAGVVGPKLVDWDDPQRLQEVGLRVDRYGEAMGVVEPDELDQEQHDAVRDVFALPSACLLVRADLFRALGGFDPAIEYHGDSVELCWRAHLSGARVLVAPGARVRHRADLPARRPDLAHRQAAARQQLLTALSLSSRWRAAVTFLTAALVALAATVVGVFTGSAREGLAGLRAWAGVFPRLGVVAARRRRTARLRAVPDREVRTLMSRGSLRLGALVRQRTTTTEVVKDRTRLARRPLRRAGQTTLATWAVVLVLFLLGSRAIVGRGMRPVGDFLRVPESASSLFRSYASGWWSSGFGRSEAAPTGVGLLGVTQMLGFGRSGLVTTLLVLAPLLVGFIGMFHLSAVFRNDRARLAALVAYAANPLPYASIAGGRWAPVVVYGALPWALELVRRASGLQAATSLVDADGVEVTDAMAVVGIARQVRVVAALALLDAVVGAFVPAFPLVVVAAAALIAASTLAVRGTATTLAGLGAAAIAAIVAFVLHLPWSARFLERGGWDDLVGQRERVGVLGLARLSRFEIGKVPLAALAVAFFVPLVVAPLVARGWRLTWAARCGALVVGFGALALVADRGTVALPEAGVLLVPVAAGLALAAAVAVAAFDEDVKGGRIGWQQPVALASFLALGVAAVPAVISTADGRWNSPRADLDATLRILQPDPPSGDYRVLYLGDARVLPLPGRPYRDGVAYAVSDDGPLTVLDMWATRPGAADALVVDALDAISSNTTLRAGRMLAPLGIRYVVVPIIDNLRSSRKAPLPVPLDLEDAFADQLDMQRMFVSDQAIVYENTAALPLRSMLSGAAVQASDTAGAAALVRADFSGANPALVGQEPPVDAVGPVPAGTFYDAVGNDGRWRLTVDGERVPARSAFGWSMAYEIPRAGEARLSYATPFSRHLALGVQILLWVVTALATSRFLAWRRWWTRRRRRRLAAADGPLISLRAPLETSS